MTELEILHGVLHNPHMAAHACFYLRDPAYIETLPKGERGGYWEASEELADKRDALKERIRGSGFRAGLCIGRDAYLGRLRAHAEGGRPGIE